MTGARISVIVPATNAAGTINALVDHIRVVGYGMAPEIVVVDGDPAGRTLAALARDGVTALPAGPGLAAGQNAGAAAAGGDRLLFLPVGTRLPVGAFQAVTSALADQADAGAFSLSIRSGNPFGIFWPPRPTSGRGFGALPARTRPWFVRRDLFQGRRRLPGQARVWRIWPSCGPLARAGARICLLPLRVAIADQHFRDQGTLADRRPGPEAPFPVLCRTRVTGRVPARRFDQTSPDR